MIHQKLPTLLALCLCTTLLMAQTSKSVTVSNDEPFTDHLSLKSDTKDMDLMVKLVFDENKNQLTVSLISYRTLFVFWDNILYKSAIKRRWIKPDRLTYVATNEYDDKFRLTKAYRNTLPQPFKEHVFKKWIEYEGLQPVAQELKMVNDYIEQPFDIQDQNSHVIIRLRDVLLMDLADRKGNVSWYDIPFGKDLNLEYQVTIQRNPCFGKDKELAAAQAALATVQKSYQSFKNKYNKRVVNNSDVLQSFKELKKALVAQFPKDSTQSDCPDIQQVIDQYNATADSLSQVRVVLASEAPAGTAGATGGEVQQVLDTRIILAAARQVDSTVARWLRSKDIMERRDLCQQCDNIIRNISKLISRNPGQNKEEQRAVQLFKQAQQYYNRTCK